MKRAPGTRCLVVAGFLAVLAQDVTAQIKSTGIGSTTCAQFTALHEESPSDTETVFYSWGLGVMSGMNISLREERANLQPHNFGSKAQKGYIRRFCEDRPSALYVEAVRDLYDTLRKKQSLPPWQFSRQRHK